MQIDTFVDLLKQQGMRQGAGVPCSYFTPLVNAMVADPELDYVSATNEGEAVAFAAGRVAAGQPCFALMQNSGLGNAVSPITSLLHTYQIPVVLLISHRGQPGHADEPQHALMGEITEQLVALCGLRTHILEPDRFADDLAGALGDGVPAGFIVRRGTFTGGLPPAPTAFVAHSRARVPETRGAFTPTVTRAAALAAILPLLNRGLALADGAGAPAVVSTTGKLSRELYELDDQAHDKRNRFYMVGSMGCAAAFGLGIARARPDRQVLVLDGDGALLMRFGALATAGHLASRNFHHVTFDNGAHDSTGGQSTASPTVDFAAVALACGYRHAETVDDAHRLPQALADHLASAGPTHLRMVIIAGARGDLGRPRLTPEGCYARFSAFLRGGRPPA